MTRSTPSRSRTSSLRRSSDEPSGLSQVFHAVHVQSDSRDARWRMAEVGQGETQLMACGGSGRHRPVVDGGDVRSPCSPRHRLGHPMRSLDRLVGAPETHGGDQSKRDGRHGDDGTRGYRRPSPHARTLTARADAVRCRQGLSSTRPGALQNCPAVGIRALLDPCIRAPAGDRSLLRSGRRQSPAARGPLGLLGPCALNAEKVPPAGRTFLTRRRVSRRCCPACCSSRWLPVSGALRLR